MKIRKLTALLASLCLLTGSVPPAGLHAYAEETALTYKEFTYQKENDGITITKCDTDAEKITIPSEIDGLPVKKIGATAFYGCTLTSVKIPEGVTEIASGAFWHSKKLTSVSLPSTLTVIEGFAFQDCQSLSDISFPASLTYIGNNAFGDTAWITAQKEKSPFVTVNHILIDASAVVSNALDEANLEKERRKQAIEDSKKWERAGILTNQVGYFPELAKKATLLSDADEPVAFELRTPEGKAVFKGTSQPMGLDADSQDNVHVLDFSEFKETGTYKLWAFTGEESRPFQIGVLDNYSSMAYDALNYFYLNRSGIPIEQQYITSGNPEELSREAGHAPDIAEIQNIWGYEGTSGEQDVTGGWYDAGDYGKYVVNAGISLWTMQNQYERAVLKGTADPYQDGTMKLPENQNGYPDLLDEARFEMEWMLKMIVQDGDCKGMAYHKIHDNKWTAIGTTPFDNKMQRIILPPSTAASLNLAACGAQAYRLWKDLDPDFAETCLNAAKEAYAAAAAHPDMYAPSEEFGGGGAYQDDNVTDEFYWAACELYLSTGDKEYYEAVQQSDEAFQIYSNMNGKSNDGLTGSFDWGRTSALGTLSLTLYPEKLTKEENASLKKNLTRTADEYLEMESEQGYGLPYRMADNAYPWGSNSFISNIGIVLAYAYDMTNHIDYLNGMVGAADYLLGRNSTDYSYVTGYGSHSTQYPHHRWWAKAEKKDFPKAPCGVLAGGPNSGLDDPVILKEWKEKDVIPQKAYIDDIQAYSVNECAINWNSSLAWTISYLCEQNGGLQTVETSLGEQIPELPLPEDVPVPELHVQIPDDITSIGEQIFGKYTYYVNEVILPDSVKNIGKQAFYKCSNLKDITLPENLEIVGENAFAETPWLEEVQKNSPLLIINGLLIDGKTAKGDVTIPKEVTSVLGNAFYMNTDITSVSFSEGVQSIGTDAFNGCSELKTVYLPETLETISSRAFADTALTSLTIPANVAKIAEEAFINCKSLPEVKILSKDASIGTEAFGCTSTFTSSGQYSYIFIHGVDKDFHVFCNPDSTAEKYASATGVQAELFGDASGDGTIDILDVIMINKAILGKEKLSETSAKASDVNQSGKPDSADSLSVLKYIVGLITSF